MVNKPRNKGTYAESALVGYLRVNGWPYAERRSLKGGQDQGDVTGCPGLAWECKYANAGMKLASWLGQTAVECANANADHGILVVKPRGTGVVNVDSWYAVMEYLDHELLRSKVGGLLPVSEPITYNAVAVASGLREHVHVFTGVPFALTMVPPGGKDVPERHYRVMYLRDMITVLRQAGYGSPLEE